MFSTRVKRLMFTLTVCLLLVGGTVSLSSEPTIPTVKSPTIETASFIRCEESTGGNCRDQCDLSIYMCGSTTCCARQYYENGECEDAHEDIFTCDGNPMDVEN